MIASSVLLIAADLCSGVVEDWLNYVAYILILIWFVVSEFFVKRLPKDPFVRYHKLLDVVCVFFGFSVVLIKCIILIAADVPKFGILLGGGSLFAFAIIGLYIYFKVLGRDEELQKQLESSDKKNEILQGALNRNFSSLDEFLTVASAAENNPKLFKEHFDRFFNISVNKKNHMLGDLLDVVNENYHHIIDHLRQQYPTLIYEELALCALICMGFSSSSIGVIFGNTKSTSIYNRRYRLRKKLNIPPDMQIERFLNERIELLSSQEAE